MEMKRLNPWGFTSWIVAVESAFVDAGLSIADFPCVDFRALFFDGMEPRAAVAEAYRQNPDLRPDAGDSGILDALDFEDEPDHGEPLEYEYFENGGAPAWPESDDGCDDY